MIKFFHLFVTLPLLVTSKTPSNVQLNFNRMTNRFQKYSNQDISNLGNDRLQHLIMGGREALKEPKVVNSFSILYEDIMPVRFGGNILFNMLDKAITNANKKSQISINVTSKIDVYGNTGNAMSNKRLSSESKKVIKDVLVYFLEQQNQSVSSVSSFQGLFSDIDQNKDNNLTFEEFSDWIASVPQSITTSESIGVSDGTDSVTAAIYNDTVTTDMLPCPKVLFQEIDTDGNGLLTREEFEAWTSLCLSRSDADDTFDSSLIITNGISSEMRLEDMPLTSERNKQHRARYLHMVSSFATWGDKFSSSDYQSSDGEGSSNDRMTQVIEGCFAGAKISGVVKALGILYEEYLPLRIAGDIVFNLVESKMASK